MFCNNCGSELQANQAICPRCSVPVARGYLQRSRVESHLSVLGVLWIAYGIMHAIGACAVYFARYFVFGGYGPPESQVPWFIGPVLQAVAIFLLVTGIIGLVAGVGLIRAELWARPLIIALAFVSLLNAPFGTALGVYTLWVLLGTGSATEYERVSALKAAAP